MVKKIGYISFLFLVLLVSVNHASAQKDQDNQIALQYYRNAEYDKAAVIYKRLYESSHSSTYFLYYLNSLTYLKKYDEAERLIKDQIKFNKSDLSIQVELGYIYKLEGQDSKSKSTYNSIVKKIDADQFQISQVANAFIAKREYEFAQQVYEQGRKLFKGNYGFQMELAQLYYYQRNYAKMISEYLDLLQVSEQYLQTVQNRLQNAVYSDIDNSLKEILKEALLQRLNQNPDVTVFSELLVWLYVQDKDFEGAFIQAKALDMRMHEDGHRLIALARIATDNQDFDVAVQSYQYVINKGKNLEYFYEARNEMLSVMFKRIELGLDTRNEDFGRLEQSYITTLQELGTNAETVDMVKDLAHLQAFYLNKTANAQLLLENAVNMRGVDPMKSGEVQLELADVYLLEGNVWDATLAYARVEDKNQQNPIGSEAKFRKARLAYFIGNFDWARAQLDVLKASTSKLIANDAAYLALFIYENSGWDSTEIALETYSRADFLHYQKKDSLAILTLDTLLANYPEDALADESWFMKGEILRKEGKYTDAEQAYQMVISHFYSDILADNAMYALADMYQHELNEPNKAMECYRKILMDFSDSIFTIEARKQFRILRGDKLVD